MAKASDSLHALAAACGVQASYIDLSGAQREASPEALRATLAAMGCGGEPAAQLERLRAERSDRLLEPVRVAWNGRGRIRLRMPARTPLECALELEDGEVLEWGAEAGPAIALPRRVPIGRHMLNIRSGAGEERAVLLAAPRELPGGETRELGVFVPLYALHSEQSWGMGDLRDLRALEGWAAEQGCGIVGTLPLLACFLDKAAFEPSPYAPVSRLFWNELFLDVQEAARAIGRKPPPRPRLPVRGWVDYRAVAAAKHEALADLALAAWKDGAWRAAMESFIAERPEVVPYARFRAQVQRRGVLWPAWPAREREGQLPEQLNEHGRYHIFVQHMLHLQLSAMARDARASLYLDLPVGVHGGGYDVWRYRDSFAVEASVGAPPDQLFEGGQNWGFPPLHPQHSRRDGHAYFAACLRNHLQYAKVLRIDHVMGLHRLFWIPPGIQTRDGVYVQYPAEELIAVLGIEAHRAGARIVGENLGTVPEEVNQAMQRHRIMGMFVGQFAFRENGRNPLPPVPEGQLASLNTHDTPTFAGFLAGRDIDERARMGLIDAPAAKRERAGRRRLARLLAEYGRARGEKGKPAARALAALLKNLAASQAAIVLVTLEDLWQEDSPQNIPGTTDEYPCWRRQTDLSLEEILRSRSLKALLQDLARLRQRPRRARAGGQRRKPAARPQRRVRQEARR